MCGIAGAITHLAEPGVRAMLHAMVAALAHRGPDDHGIELRQAAGSAVAGLCATRLAIRDPSPRGHQPMVGPTGTILVLNGEIYNAAALRRDLERRKHSFHGYSDTEVALRAYEEWGAGCVERLEGMFAIAVWDPREEQLLLARDRLGIKPLYYARLPDGELLFASEARAIVPHLRRPPELSRCGVMSYLATGAVVEPDTIVEDVKMLAPGHLATWVRDRLEICRYWSLEEAFQGDVPALSAKALAQELRERLESTVRAQLVSDVPLAVFFSGGMDSSAVVGLASNVAPTPPSTASIVFGETAFSEATHIHAVRSRFQTDHHEIALTAEDFLREIPLALGAMDQPTVDGVNTYVVAKLAKQAGFTVVLSGLGGDELFAGYWHFHTIPRLEALQRAVPTSLAGPAATLGRLRWGDSDRSRKFARWLRGEADDPLELHRELFEPDVRAELFPSGPPTRHCGARHRIGDRVNAISFSELQGYMRNVLLRDSDVMSMAHGLELRVPLLDERIVDLVARIPGRYKVARGRTKPLLADATADLLPESVRARKKAGFVLPFADWMRGAIREEVEEKLLDKAYGGPVADLLDADAVGRTWRSYYEGTSSWHRPWALYALKVWGERQRVGWQGGRPKATGLLGGRT